jgi:DNA-directed RNA polymerase subunit K/omega
MGVPAKPTTARSIRLLLSKVDMGTMVNRYEFSVAAARRARDIHVLTVDTEERSQQKSLLAAVDQIITGKADVVRPLEE